MEAHEYDQEYVSYGVISGTNGNAGDDDDTTVSTTCAHRGGSGGKAYGTGTFKKIEKGTPENGCFTIVRRVKDTRMKISCYATKYNQGTQIRNATNGLYEDNLYVGKIDENLFFKVRVVSGELGHSPYGKDFYYDSPEQYERHCVVTLPMEVKARWVENNQLAKKRKLQSLERSKFHKVA
jgi:hypothetical protein